MRVAVIDIGTVTTRLMVADVVDGHINELARCVVITHLGEGLIASGALSVAGIDRVAVAVHDFLDVATSYECKRIRCIATSASRDASNGEDLVARLRDIGVEPEIISGDEEATLSFAGATYGVSGGGILVADPGGGSTELTLGNTFGPGGAGGPMVLLSESIDIGSRRLTDMFGLSDPPTTDELNAVRIYIRMMLEPFFEDISTGGLKIETLVAVAGTATTMTTVLLAMDEYDPQAVQGSVVTAEDLGGVLQQFLAVQLDKRMLIPGLEPARAGVIIPGTLILIELLNLSGLDSMVISDNDLLQGMILKLGLDE